jgi:STE24 endopeptidase
VPATPVKGETGPAAARTESQRSFSSDYRVMQGFALPVFVGFFAAERAADLGLATLDVWHSARTRELPVELEGLIDEEVAERARRYARSRARLTLLRGLIGTALTATLLLSGALPWLDGWLGHGGLAPREHFVLYLFALALMLSLADLPFAAWRTCVIDRRHGLGACLPRAFCRDRLRDMALVLVTGLPFLYAAEAALSAEGAVGWVRLMGLVIFAQLAMAWVWPNLVAPALSRQRPVPPGPLEERLRPMVAMARLTIEDVALVEGGRRRSPAMVVGLGRPKVLLDATLCERLTTEEIAAVVAHELGHVMHRHLPARLALSVGSALVISLPLLATILWPALLTPFGFGWPSRQGAVAVVALLGGGFLFWLAPLGAYLSRRQEAQADREAVRLTGRPEALAAALLDLAEDHLVNLAPHPFTVAWRFSHPALAERLLAIAREADAP